MNLAEWRAHLLLRLATQIDASGDAALMALRDELAAYPAPAGARLAKAEGAGEVAVPLKLESPAGVLSLISTTTVFGTAIEVTLAELAIEAFFPADGATAERLNRLAAAAPAD